MRGSGDWGDVGKEKWVKNRVLSEWCLACVHVFFRFRKIDDGIGFVACSTM